MRRSKAVVTKRDPLYTALLVHPDVDRGVCGTFVKMGWLQQDLCDRLQEVRLRAIQAARDGRISRDPETNMQLDAIFLSVERTIISPILAVRCKLFSSTREGKTRFFRVYV